MLAWARVGVLALLWGSTYLWIDLSLAALTPIQVTVVRCALGAAVLLGAARATRQRLPRDRATWLHLLVAAFFCNALPFALFSIGQQTVDSGLAGVLNATTPLWSLLLGLGLGAERRPGPARLVGLALGFAGVLVIFAPGSGTGLVGWGSLAILGATVSYAIAFAHMGRTLVGRGVPTLPLAAAQLLAATALTSLALPFGGLRPVAPDPTALGAVVVLGVVATGVTFLLTYRVIAAEGATSAATVGYLLPVVSVGLGALVLDEALDARVVAGMATVLVGVALTRWRPRSSAAARPASAPAHAPADATTTAPARAPAPRLVHPHSGGRAPGR